MELVEIGRISSKHVRVTVASPKGAQTARSVGSTPPITSAHLATAMNNHVSATTEEMTKPLVGKEEGATDHVEEMDTREGMYAYAIEMYPMHGKHRHSGRYWHAFCRASPSPSFTNIYTYCRVCHRDLTVTVYHLVVSCCRVVKASPVRD